MSWAWAATPRPSARATPSAEPATSEVLVLIVDVPLSPPASLTRRGRDQDACGLNTRDVTLRRTTCDEPMTSVFNRLRCVVPATRRECGDLGKIRSPTEFGLNSEGRFIAEPPFVISGPSTSRAVPARRCGAR